MKKTFMISNGFNINGWKTIEQRKKYLKSNFDVYTKCATTYIIYQ